MYASMRVVSECKYHKTNSVYIVVLLFTGYIVHVICHLTMNTVMNYMVS